MVTLLEYQPEEKIDYFGVIQAMSTKSENLDIYNNKYMLTITGRSVKIVDISEGIILSKELDYDPKFVSMTQESSKKLPNVFILTPQHDLLLYSLSIKKTNLNNKVKLEMKLHYEVNIMMMNEISSFPVNFQMSKREFTHFEA